MAILEGKAITFVVNPYFTDETDYLSIDTSTFRDIYVTKKFKLGMSFYGPDNFSEQTMVVPFTEEISHYTQGSNKYIYKWDITQYQTAIRSFLDSSTTSEIYIYVISTEHNGTIYRDWQKCFVSISDKDAAPIYTNGPNYTVTDSLSTSLTGNTSTIIRYVSDVSVSFTAEARKGSSMYSYTIKNGSQSVNVPLLNNQTTVSISKDFTDIDSPTFYTTIQDSRNYRTSNFVQASKFIDYFFPTCNIQVEPSSTGGTTYVYADGQAFNGSFGVSSNTITVQYRYKTASSSSWGSWYSMTVTRDGNNYTASGSVSGLDYRTKYIFQGRIVDKITTVLSSDSVVKSIPVFDCASYVLL